MASKEQTAVWRAHPNAAGPASMLLDIHDQFRGAARQLAQLVEQAGDLALIERIFQPLAEVLHHHHHAEEAMVFPFVLRQTGIAPEALQADHDEMTLAIEAVAACLAARDREGELIAAALTRFHDILLAHLDREEELVIPVFLALGRSELWALLGGSA